MKKWKISKTKYMIKVQLLKMSDQKRLTSSVKGIKQHFLI